MNKGQYSVEALSIDHKPNLPLEKERIHASNGKVMQMKDMFGRSVGPYRVWLKNEQAPGLAMSRSIGDLVAQSAGVISTPEIK